MEGYIRVRKTMDGDIEVAFCTRKYRSGNFIENGNDIEMEK